MAQSPTPTDTHFLDPTVAATQVLAIGPWQQTEFVLATTQIPLAKHWQTAANIEQACEILTNEEHDEDQLAPELIFLAQPLPDTYLQSEIVHLQRLAPLARLVIVAGTWCEGEVRTGTPPPGVLRLYWYDLARWWQAALRRLDAGLNPLWSVPFDHALAGRYSTDNPPQLATAPPNTASPNKYVLIEAADYAVYETLAAALKSQGLVTLRPSEGQTKNATAGIWDGGQLSQNELTNLTRFCQQVDGPVLVLLDFPRVEHLQQAQAAGATAVFAKPYIVEELIAELFSPIL